MFLGIWLLLAPLLPEFSGYASLRDALGGDGAIARFFVAFLLMLTALLVKEKDVLRNALRGILALSTGGSRPGDRQERVRETVDILIAALGARTPTVRDRAHQHLKRLTP